MAHLTTADLLSQAKQLAAVATAIVHPVTPDAIAGAIDASNQGLIIPVFIGPTHKILQAAKEVSIDLSAYQIHAVPHSHAAAAYAVELARAGQVGMLMKGSLHTDEFMQAIVAKDSGLHTARRMSHVFVTEIPTYSKLLLLTDCALNIFPDLMAKRDIVQNALDIANAIGIEQPKVAILAAVETINPKMPSTIDAACLCKMADRNQISGGILDGPLAFDNAISTAAAQLKGIESKVAGQADILLAPDLESGNMLAKQLQYLANATLAGIVVGARLPIVLTSRADHASARLLSCALGRSYGHYLQQTCFTHP